MTDLFELRYQQSECLDLEVVRFLGNVQFREELTPEFPLILCAVLVDIQLYIRLKMFETRHTLFRLVQSFSHRNSEIKLNRIIGFDSLSLAVREEQELISYRRYDRLMRPRADVHSFLRICPIDEL